MIIDITLSIVYYVAICIMTHIDNAISIIHNTLLLIIRYL